MENLPSNVIYNIFKNLPQKELLKCTTVCKLFNEIIENRKLISTLVIQDNCHPSLQVFNRKYNKIVITEDIEPAASKALESNGENILEVKFENLETTLSSIIKILNYLPNVQKITFYYTRIEDDDEIVKEYVQPMSKNISLHLLESTPKIFKIIPNMSVSKLEMEFYGDTPYFDFADLSPFMKKQKELKTLLLSGIYESNLIYGSILKGEYHLTEFEIRNSDLEEWIYLETYLGDHFESLRKLSLKSLPWDPTDVIKLCNNLKSLDLEEITVDELEDEMATVEQLSTEDPGQFLIQFPNLKKLFMQNGLAETNKLVNGRNIVDLTIRFGALEEIRCENVKKLKLMNIEGPITEDFFKIHSKVEDLRLENIFILNDSLLEGIVRNLQDLKVLTVYGLNELTAEAFKILKKYCKNLRVLDTKTWTQHFSINDWKCLHESNNGIEIYVENFNF